MNILIVKTSAIGDVTHTLPALNALRKQYPDALIDWLVEEAAADLITGHPDLNRVLVSRRKRWVDECKKGSFFTVIREVVSFIRELRAVRYDILIDFQGLLKSGILIALSRAKRKIGFGKGMEHAEHSYLFLNEKTPPVDMNIHAVDREKVLLAAIGVEHEGDYRLFIPEESKQELKDLLTEAEIDVNKPLIAINPMTTWPTKHWNDKSFAELADLLIRRGMAVVFTGGSNDRVGVDEIIGRMKERGAYNLVGKTSLKSLAALYSQARAVVSTDTGPMHIAAAAGTPVVAIFGPTAPWRTGPYGKQHKVIRLDLPCSPCLKKQCKLGTNACMAEIDAEMVMKEVESLCLKR